MERLKRIIILAAGLFLAVLFIINLANAYHVLTGDESGDGNRDSAAAWDDSIFIHDNSGDNPDNTIDFPDDLESHPAADPSPSPSPHAPPNDDALGLLYVVDNSVDGGALLPPNLCDAISPYDNSGIDPYDAIFLALATWDTDVPESTINMQFVCSAGDINETNVAGIVGSFDSSLLLNGFNEILIEDTADGDIFDAIGLDFLDLTTVLGIGIPLDDQGIPIAAENAMEIIASKSEIVEAFLIINESPGTPMDENIRQGVLLHEIGHTLGLAHTNAVLNARELADDYDQSVPGNLTKIPTMHAFVLASSAESSSLEVDDKAATIRNYCDICGGALLGDAGLGAISGFVHDENSDSILGASVIAYPMDGSGDEIGVLVGGYPELPGNSLGNYQIDFVPEGDYYVTVIPLREIPGGGLCDNQDSACVSPGENIDGIFPDRTADFAETFYEMPALMTAGGLEGDVVSVQTGMQTAGIDFNITVTATPSGTPVVVESPAAAGGGCVAIPSKPKANLFNFIVLLFPFAFIQWKRRKTQCH